MKRIAAYKKLFEVEGELELRQLKKTYRNLVKEWHPDKFLEGDAKKEEAEVMSRKIIDGYHFLVSIAPETKAATLDDYNAAIESGLVDFEHKNIRLEVTFANGATYEYFGVPKNIFIKLINSDKRQRFAKRSIFNSYLYRKSKREVVA